MSGFRSSQVYEDRDDEEQRNWQEARSYQQRYDEEILQQQQQQQQQQQMNRSRTPTSSSRSSSSSTSHHSSTLTLPRPASASAGSISSTSIATAAPASPSALSTTPQKRPSSAASGGRRTPSSATSLSSPSLATPSRIQRSDSSSSDMAKNFKVVIRIRPPLQRELDATNGIPYRDVVRVSEENRAISVCEVGMPTYGDPTALTAAALPVYRFTFDHVYGQHSSQAEVYAHTAHDAVMSTLQGYNSTVLAYGQTGTGKTYTVEGGGKEGERLLAQSAMTTTEEREMRGIIPRSVEEIFNYIRNTAPPNIRFLVRASYVQIYNEVISDLLKPERTNLLIREDKRRGVFVEGLSEWVVRSPKEVYGLIKRGSALRATGATRINETSSRSHALFIIIVEQNEVVYEKAEESTDQQQQQQQQQQREKHRSATPSKGRIVRQSFKVGKMNLVDLAGSERVRISGAKGRRLNEACNINQSLSALGNVISALTEGSRQHIPYRDSKLTRILEDSFGGNVKMCMISTIAPCAESYLETLSTLKFSTRAKRIENKPQVNEDLDEKALLRKYEYELKKLRQELQTKSKNVVDKRKLIEVEEQRRRAEHERMQALANMEKMSHDLLVEKSAKRKLEERIKEMSSQLLVGGTSYGVGSSPSFSPTISPDPSAIPSLAQHPQNASDDQTRQYILSLQSEQDRIRLEYSHKLSELEKERDEMESEKVQTNRYKTLLLKQRDIMIQLTARLNERDQSIIQLQEELDSYDRHQKEMEDELDQKRHRLILLQRMNVDGNQDGTAADAALLSAAEHARAASSNGGLYSLFPIDEAPYFEENSLSPGVPSPNATTTLPQYGATLTLPNASLTSPRASPSASSGTPPSPRSSVDAQAAIEAEVARRVQLELQKRDAVQSQSSSSPSATSDLAEALQQKEKESMNLREELEQLKRNSPAYSSPTNDSAALLAQNAQLQRTIMQLQEKLQHPVSPSSSPTFSPPSSDQYRELQQRYDLQLEERHALKTILEKKMKTLIDSIANATIKSSNTESKDAVLGGSALPSRTKREIEVLQRLVEASLNALKSTEEDEQTTTASSAASSTSISSIPSPLPYQQHQATPNHRANAPFLPQR